MEFPDWLAVVLGLLLLLYFYGTWDHNYFVKHKIPFMKPLPLVGNSAPFLFKRESIADVILKWYRFGEGSKIIGSFDFGKPTFILRDPDMIKTITVKDFDHFTDHRMPLPDDDFFGKNLFALKGDRWRDMRHTLSPAFTSSKMKNMFTLIEKCGQQMGDHLEKICKATSDGVLQLEMKDFYTKYTNDVIATAAFGLHVDSLEEPDNEFYKMGKEATDFSSQILKFVLISISPKLMGKFGIQLISNKVTNFFRSLVHGTIEEREKKGIVRPDMIHLLMQARKEAKNTVLTDDDITAQAFIFFFAGFDTSSTLLCFVSHLLAVHPDIQQRVREEIDSVLADHNGEITYEAIQQMKYMDCVISETLRLWPPAIASDRVCVRPYTLQATDSSPEIKFNVGDVISIPSIGIHRDARFFPDPERFDPDRFNEENKGNINPFAYLPFGLGPRACIGMRFAQMEAKIAITVLFSRFNLRLVEKSSHPIKMSKKKFTLVPDEGFWLGLELRTADNEM